MAARTADQRNFPEVQIANAIAPSGRLWKDIRVKVTR
jgi:hypothetical protein